MKRLFIAVIFIFVAQNVVAHSGHKKESAPVLISELSATDPMYATEDKESDPFDDSDLFSPSDLFMQGEVITDEPDESMEIEGSHNKSEDHKMPEVESAKIKAVETSSKGYGIAAGITFFAFLLFAGLTFIRPGE
jgi:hypothetical protein